MHTSQQILKSALFEAWLHHQITVGLSSPGPFLLAEVGLACKSSSVWLHSIPRPSPSTLSASEV